MYCIVKSMILGAILSRRTETEFLAKRVKVSSKDVIGKVSTQVSKY